MIIIANVEIQINRRVESFLWGFFVELTFNRLREWAVIISLPMAIMQSPIGNYLSIQKKIVPRNETALLHIIINAIKIFDIAE